MILHALNDLYERRSRDPDPTRRLPAPGFEDKGIPFVIELLPEGRAAQLRDTRQVKGKRLIPQDYLVPQAVKKTSGVSANLLWDSAEYVLGVSQKDASNRLEEQCAAFKTRVLALQQFASGDPGLAAVVAFLNAPDLTPLQTSPAWAELLETNAYVSFELIGDAGLVCERPAVRSAMEAQNAELVAGDRGPCLVLEGRDLPIARLHTSIKGVWNAQSSGANIVSFNLPAFNSYGKEQGLNAPVSEQAVFAYTTALNALLDRDGRNCVQVGDASTVFWADAPHEFDGPFTLADLLGEPKADNPDRGRDAVHALFKSVQTGHQASAEDDVHFYVLGLAPNAARISVRFWLPRVPFSQLGTRLRQHFDDIRVVRRYEADPEVPSLFRLLTSIALQGKADKIPPRLAGEWMRAILEGTALPAALLSAAVQRCRAEREVSYLRAAVLKALVNRRTRRDHDSTTMPIKEALDMDQPAPAYRLGRLFATLERIQEAAQPGINATIRDRYYGAASTTPVAVFTTLLRLKNAHLKKLSGGLSTHFEKLIGEILQPMQDFPRQLSLPQQAEFALGYYHQRQDFFTKKTDDTDPNQAQGDQA